MQILSNSKKIREQVQFGNYQQEQTQPIVALPAQAPVIQEDEQKPIEYGGLTFTKPTNSIAAFMTATQPQQQQAQEQAEESNANSEIDKKEVGANTLNPSILFDDKSQAEWMGNVVKNSDEQATRAMIQAAQKPSKWLFIMLFIAGMLCGGFVLLAVLQWAGVGIINTGTSKTVTSPTAPAAPGNGLTGWIPVIGHYALTVVSWLL
jgi:hypothetical protein